MDASPGPLDSFLATLSSMEYTNGYDIECASNDNHHSHLIPKLKSEVTSKSCCNTLSDFERILMEDNVEEQPVNRCLSSYVDDGSTESHRYYLSRRTTLEMLKDRGYSVPSSEIDISLAEFRATHGQSPDVDRLRFSATHLSDPSKRILVIFCGPGVVKVNVIRSIAGQIVNRETLTGLILIVQNQITSQALKAVKLFSFKVEIFQITDLLVNITKHVLKPKHEVLTERQKQDLLKKYNLEENQLPRMLETDAIARYYGLERGQVVKVTYSGDITQMHVTHQCVW